MGIYILDSFKNPFGTLTYHLQLDFGIILIYFCSHNYYFVFRGVILHICRESNMSIIVQRFKNKQTIIKKEWKCVDEKKKENDKIFL